MDISKWFLKHLKVLKGLYIAWYIVWQTAIVAVALTWLGLIGLLLCKLSFLTTLPQNTLMYLTVGVGLVIFFAMIVGLVIVGTVLTENWWTWSKRSIFRKVRNKTWDLEYVVQNAKQLEYEQEVRDREKLTELKNAAWEL